MKKLFGGLVISIAAGGFVWLAYSFYTKTHIGARAPVVLANGFYYGHQARRLPELILRDVHGHDFNLQQLSGQWSLVFLGYSLCPDICPPTIMQMEKLHHWLQQKNKTPPRMVFVSVDAEHDTPARIQQFLAHTGESVMGLGGDAPTIQKLNQFFGTYSQRRDTKNDAVYLLDHSSKLFVINPHGQLIAMLNPPFTSADLAEQLQHIQDDHVFIAQR